MRLLNSGIIIPDIIIRILIFTTQILKTFLKISNQNAVSKREEEAFLPLMNLQPSGEFEYRRTCIE